MRWGIPGVGYKNLSKMSGKTETTSNHGWRVAIYINKRHYSWIVLNLQPLLIIKCGFLFILYRGARMKIGAQIEQIRISENIPIFIMCNILSIETELEYHQIIIGRTSLTTYQKIMFVVNTCRALDI